MMAAVALLWFYTTAVGTTSGSVYFYYMADCEKATSLLKEEAKFGRMTYKCVEGARNY